MLKFKQIYTLYITKLQDISLSLMDQLKIVGKVQTELYTLNNEKSVHVLERIRIQQDRFFKTKTYL